MSKPENANAVLSPVNLLVTSSSLLLMWNLVGFDAESFEGPLKFLASVPKGVVPVVLIFVVVYQAYSVVLNSKLSPPTPDKSFLLGFHSSLAYLIAASAVLSYFSGLTAVSLLAEVRRSPTCLVFAGFGWALVIPSSYALWSSSAQVLSSQGLKILGPTMLVLGALAIWIAASIAGNLWPGWVGIWAGFFPGVLILLAWRLR